MLASVFTLIEGGGLVAIIVVAIYADLPIMTALATPPPFEAGALSGIAFGTLLAFFAFIGFEDLATSWRRPKRHAGIFRAPWC